MNHALWFSMLFCIVLPIELQDCILLNMFTMINQESRPLQYNFRFVHIATAMKGHQSNVDTRLNQFRTQSVTMNIFNFIILTNWCELPAGNVFLNNI